MDMREVHLVLVVIFGCSFSLLGFAYPTNRSFLSYHDTFIKTNRGDYNVSTEGTNSTFTATNFTNATSCTLKILDNSHSIQEIISRHKKNGIGLIYFTFQIDGELSEDIIDSMVNPYLWIWASRTFGTNVLLFKEKNTLIIHKYIKLGIIEEKVNLKVIPQLCLNSYDTQDFIDLILKTVIIENSTVDDSLSDGRICIDKMKLETFSTENAEFDYWCIDSIAGSNLTFSELKQSSFMSLFSSFLTFSFLLLFLILLSLLSYKIATRAVSSENDIWLHAEDNKLRLNLTDMKHRFIHSRSDSFKLSSWIYDKLFRCQIQENESEYLDKCCDAPILFCFKEFTWHHCCKKFVVMFVYVSSVGFLFLLYSLFNHGFDDKNKSQRESYAHRKGAYSVRQGRMFIKSIFFLSFVFTISILTLLLPLLLIKNRIIRSIRFAFSNVPSSRLMYDNLRRSIKSMSFYPFRKLGLFGLILFPYLLFCFIALIFQSLCLCRFVPFSQTSRMRIYIVTLFIIFISYPILNVFTFAFVVIFTNLSFCLIIAVLNYGTYLKYLIFAIISVFYVVNCFSKMSKKYHIFYSVLNKYILDKTGLTSKRKCNTLFFITVNRKNLKLNVVNDRDTFTLHVEGGVPVITNEINKVLLSGKFFKEMSAKRHLLKALPGTPFSNFVSTLCHLLCIFFFLFFVFLIVINFGEDYIGSDFTQALAIFVSSLLPWVIKQNVSQSEDEIDLIFPEFQYLLENQISLHHEIFRMKNSNHFPLNIGVHGEDAETIDLSESREVKISVDSAFVLEIEKSTISNE